MTDRIDSVFKEKLDGYASPVAAGLWDGISQEMIRQRRRRWLLYLFILLVLSGLAIYYFNLEVDGNPEDPIAEKSFAVAHVPGEENNATITLAETSNTSSEGKDLEFYPSEEKSSVGLKVSSFRRASSKPDVPLVKEKCNLGALSGKNISSNTLVPNPPFIVHQAASNSHRCMIYPGQLEEKSFLLGSGVKPRFKSKTLGDCFEGPPTRYMIGLNASLDYPFRSIIGNNTGDLGDYINQRNLTESEFVSFNAGIQSGYFHPSGFLLRSGLQYTQINEKFQYIKENVIKIQTQITIDTMINQDGSYTIHRDTSIVEVLGREEMKTTNHFRMLDIPLIFGYTFDWKRVSIEMNGGVIFNVLSRSGGRIFNTDMVPSYYGYKGTEFSPFKTYYGLSLYGSLSILSNFYGRTQFFLEPNARYYIKSFSSSDYPIRQKYFVLGLSTGVRYYF